MSWSVIAKQLAIPIAKAVGEIVVKWLKGEGRKSIDDMLELQSQRLRDAIDRADRRDDYEEAARLERKLMDVEHAIRRKK